MSKLGKCFFAGIALEKNAEKAVGWWMRAADKGDVDSMRSLACCCSRGHGVEKNAAEKAVEWWTRAADKGDETAMFNVGL